MKKVSIYHNTPFAGDREFKALTGLTKAQFEVLFTFFEPLYKLKQINPYSPEKHPKLQDKKEALFFILFYLKSYPTGEILAFNFGISYSCALQNIQYIKPILKRALQEAGTDILRSFGTEKQFQKCFEGVEDIIIDVFEINTQRPENEDIQKENYSGKKNNTP